MPYNVPDDLLAPLSDLGDFVSTLGPYRDSVVLSGGMVPIIYRHFGHASAVRQAPLTTFDLDITLPEQLAEQEGILLVELIQDSPFRRHLRGSSHPPTTVYQHRRHGDELGPIYVELLSPLVGAQASRSGEGKIQVTIQKGVEAQAIRYLDLLFQYSTVVDANSIPALRVTDPSLTFCVPHPSMYIMQKMLCRETRRPEKQGKDLAYIFDVVTLFRNDWAAIGEVTESVAQSSPKYRKWLRRSRRRLTELFESPTADGPVAIQTQFPHSPTLAATISEETVYRVISNFLDESGLRLL